MSFLKGNTKNIIEQKAAVRSRERHLLSNITAHKGLWESMTICRKVVATSIFRLAKTVMIYSAIAHEIDLMPLIRMSNDKIFLLPRVEGDDIVGCKYVGSSSLVRGAFGILEPTTPPFTDAIDLLITPALAFDYGCHRLGRGKGFYDRFIKKHAVKYILGVGYDFQLLERIPYDAEDALLNGVITPSHEIMR